MLRPVQPDAYSLSFARPHGGLVATVTGERSLEVTLAYWHAILDEVLARRPQWVLVNDLLRGHELSVDDWHALVDAMKGKGFEGLRIAHVKPFGADHIEWCEIFAREAGIDARAFADAAVAERWLRYGSSDEVA